MTEPKQYRLSKFAKDFNIGVDHVIDALKEHGVVIDRNPNLKISQEHFDFLLKKFSSDKAIKEESDNLAKQKLNHDMVHDLSVREPVAEATIEEEDISVDKLKKDIADKTSKTKKEEKEKDQEVEKAKEAEIVKHVVEPKPEPKPEKVTQPTPEPTVENTDDVIRAKVEKKEGPTILGNIAIADFEKGSKGRKKKESEPEPELAEAKKAKTPRKPKEEEVVQQPIVEETPQVPKDESTDAAIPSKPEEIETIKVQTQKLTGPNIVGRIELPTQDSKRKPTNTASQAADDKRKKRKRTDKRVSSSSNPIQNQAENKPGAPRDNKPRDQRDRKAFQPANKNEPTDKEIQDQIKATLQKLSGGGGKSKGSKIRREKRNLAAERIENAEMADALSKKIKVTEFVTANELAKLLNVNVTQIISTCMSLGMFVSINQRLDAETLALVSEEFGYEIEFVSAEVQEAINDAPDAADDLMPRPPIVTVMGHVDHGKTSLLDYVRSANVIAGEAGGITQHIGAYEVTLSNERKITFLDTPGHEAFTAMRARGAKITDVAIIVIAADDSVMPQTVEAINHAQAAGVPIVFAFNKIDKPDAAPDRVREQLSKMNILVEEWGGKFQTQEISAKKGLNIDKLLDKVLLEAEILDLKANPNRNAKGTVIEATLDKGRGYVTTMLVQTGTIKTGDVLLAGCHSGRVKAMFNERGQRLDVAGPSTPVMLLGLSGAPQAGDQFNVMDDEREARDIANKRLQLQREQGLRTHKHITLDEIGRRLAIGNFKELNVIVKGDVDGSVEALADSLLKLSTEEIQVNVIHKSVGQISESDVLLASASNAIIIGFQVRPSVNARKLAESEQIDIRLYSIIYKAIEEIKAAMEGMLAPEFEEKIVCNIEIRETFKIPKVGTIAGCMVLDGKITRNTKVRVVRDGIVTYSGELASLKRFKDDVKEVNAGYECGLNIANFNDIQIGDIVEGYEQVAIKRTLA
jgi:translation initiation factor IF-2